MRKYTLFVVMVSFMLIGVGCTSVPQIAPSPSSLSPRTDLSMNVFDPSKNKVEDVIAGLKVTSIEGLAGMEKPVTEDNIHVKFSGQVTLSGKYTYEFSDLSGNEVICFTPETPNERKKLPVLVNKPEQSNGFCFSNFEKAKDVFGPRFGQGRATIVISQYELIYAPTEVVNQAELVDLVNKDASVQ